MTRLLPLALLAMACPLADATRPTNAGPPPEPLHHLLWRISRAEGFYRTGSIPKTNNNPGALVYCGQPGATAGSRGELQGPLRFARFPAEADGWAALERDIRAKWRRRIPLRVAWRYL